MFGDDGARRHTAQLLQLGERLAHIVEFGPQLLAQRGRRTAGVVTHLAQRLGGPPNRPGQPLRAEHHEPHDQQDQQLSPADTAEHQEPSGPGVTLSSTGRP
ncbi:Uncharacterised protein [Mycobacteroides abscessus subsp. massiliense]|nr:Uncharacterised protein [Mycobacteroides abscessus subsp. massiliense]